MNVEKFTNITKIFSTVVKIKCTDYYRLDFFEVDCEYHIFKADVLFPVD